MGAIFIARSRQDGSVVFGVVRKSDQIKIYFWFLISKIILVQGINILDIFT